MGSDPTLTVRSRQRPQHAPDRRGERPDRLGPARCTAYQCCGERLAGSNQGPVPGGGPDAARSLMPLPPLHPDILSRSTRPTWRQRSCASGRRHAVSFSSHPYRSGDPVVCSEARSGAPNAPSPLLEASTNRIRSSTTVPGGSSLQRAKAGQLPEREICVPQVRAAAFGARCT